MGGDIEFYRSVVEEIFNNTREGGRLTGSPGDRWVEEYLRGLMEDLGLEVHVDSYSTRQWIPRRWIIEVRSGEGWVEVPSYFMARTGPGEAEGRLVYVGDAHSRQLPGVEGSIVVASLRLPSLSLSLLEPLAIRVSDPDGSLRESGALGEAKPSVYMTRLEPSECGCPVDPESYEASLKAGASGYVGVLENYPDMGCGEFTYYAPADGAYRSLPGLWVERRAGSKLVELAREGARARLRLEAEVGGVEGRNVYALLPGRGEEVIVIHSHHDSPYGGAVQDASGTAMVALLAKHYTEKYRAGGYPGATLVFLFTEGHFDGGSGQEAFLRAHGDWADKILVDVALEHIGLEYAAPDGKAEPTGRIEPRAIFVSEDREYLVKAFAGAVDNVKPRSLLLLPTNTILGVPSDANRLWRKGVPVASLISGPIYMFSSCDTPEKVAYNSVPELKALLTSAIDSLLAARGA